MIDILSIIPEIILLTGAFVLLFIQAFAPSKFLSLYVPFSILICMISGASVFLVPPTSLSFFSGFWISDLMSRSFKILFITGTAITLLLSYRFVIFNKIASGEYYALILLATIGMMVMASSADFLYIFLGLELLSLALYALAGTMRVEPRSGEASFKYFILGAFATAIFLFGVAFVYGSTGSTHLYVIGKTLQSPSLPLSYIMLGSIFILAGLGFKLALVPFHSWAPDVYEGSPSPISAFMAAAAKSAIFVAMMRIFLIALPSQDLTWRAIIALLAVLSMTLGNFAALAQTRVKRMLAYSSIAHAGYILVGVAAMDKTGVFSVLFYMLAYTFMNGGAFAVLVFLSSGRDPVHKDFDSQDALTFEDFRGLAYRRPGVAFALAIFLFSLAGIPPTGGFTGKFFIFSMAVENGQTLLAVIGVLNSVLSVYAYLKLTVMMYMKESTSLSELLSTSEFPIYEKSALLLTAIGTILMGVFPSLFIP